MEFQYKGLRAELDRVEVTEEELNRRMEQLRRQNPDLTVITDRPSQLGDEVILDYAGTVDGVAFEGGTAEKQALTLGSGMFIPGFEEQLVGKNVGDEVTVKVTFPKDYGHTALAGKAAEFACRLHEIRVRGEYALDDRFARAVGHCKDLATMRGMVAQSLRSYYDEKSERELQDRLIRQAADTLDYTPSHDALEQAARQQLETLVAQLGQRGLTLAQYCSFMKTTQEELLEDMREDSAQLLRVQEAVNRIAKAENVRATAEEIAEAFQQVAASNHMTAEELTQYYDAALAAAIESSVVHAKVLQLVREAAVITNE